MAKFINIGDVLINPAHICSVIRYPEAVIVYMTNFRQSATSGMDVGHPGFHKFAGDEAKLVWEKLTTEDLINLRF